MRAIQAHPALELQVMLGASGLLERFGNLEEILHADNFPISATFHTVIAGETPTTMAKSTGLGMIESSTILNNLDPDFLLVVGDRFDVISPALSGAYMNIPIIHTMGGEVTGTIDESIRHALTKLAHIHFPATEDAKHRIIKLGEDRNRVFNVGCPRMDTVKLLFDKTEDEWQNDLDGLLDSGVGPIIDLTRERFLLVSQHPVTTEYGSNRNQIESTLDALNYFKMPTIMIWPNVDAGSDEISKGIRTFRERFNPDWLHLFTNLPMEKYFLLMHRCACIVGNSSSAIREGAFLGTPAVNIGTRQYGRARGKNIIDVDPCQKQIETAISSQLTHGKYEHDSLYGDGSAGDKIAEILANLPDISAQKRIAY